MMIPNKNNLLVGALALAIVGHASNASGQTLSRDFVDFLNGELYFKYIQVEVPGQMIQYNGELLDTPIYYEGSMQGETFWLKSMEHNNEGASPGRIVGQSTNEHWMVRPGGHLAKSPRDPSMYETDAVLQKLKAVYYIYLSAVGPGMPLEPGSVSVDEANRFEAKNVHGGTLSGQFQVDESGRPVRCVYSLSSEKDHQFVVEYDFSGRASDSVIPASYVMKGIAGAKVVASMEFRIPEYEVGTLALPEGGFHGEKFLEGIEKTSPFAGTMLFSNTAIYSVLADGTLETVKAPEVSSSSGTTGVRPFLIIAAVIIPLLAIYLFSVYRRQRGSVQRSA